MCSRLAQQCNLKDRWYTLNSKLVIPGIKHEHWPALFFNSFEQWLQKQTSKPQRQRSFICRALNFHHSSLKIASKFPTASAYWFRHPSPVQIKTCRAWRRCFCSPPPFKRRCVSGWLPVCAMLVFERRARCLLLVSPSTTKKINQPTESLMILSSAQQLENGKKRAKHGCLIDVFYYAALNTLSPLCYFFTFTAQHLLYLSFASTHQFKPAFLL